MRAAMSSRIMVRILLDLRRARTRSRPRPPARPSGASPSDRRPGRSGRRRSGPPWECRPPCGPWPDRGPGGSSARRMLSSGRAAGALDAQADEIGVLPRDGVLNHPLGLGRSDRPGSAPSRRPARHGTRPPEATSSFTVSGGTSTARATSTRSAASAADESLAPGLGPGEPARLTGGRQDRLGPDGPPLAKFGQSLGRACTRCRRRSPPRAVRATSRRVSGPLRPALSCGGWRSPGSWPGSSR